MAAITKTKDQLIELFSEDQIQKKVRELADEINKEFADSEELTIVGALIGSILFASDLIRHIKIPVQLEFIRLSSYGHDTTSSGKVKPVDLTLPSLKNKDVLIVEDIVDTGLTANFLINYIKLQHRARKVKFAVMLDKSCARTYPVDIDFMGFEIDDKFVIGYGLDYLGYYRNLPYIGYFPE